MMSWRRCDREDDVRRASAAGRWTPALEGHVVVCDRCHDVCTVTRALAAPLEHRPALVDPAVLWARARATAQVRAMARVDRVLMRSQIIVAAAAVAGIAVAGRLLGVPTDAGGSDVSALMLCGGVALTVTTAFVLRWSRP